MIKPEIYMNGVGAKLSGPRKVCKILISLLVGVFLLSALYAPVYAQAQKQGDKGQRFVTIDFNDVDINLFIKYISELTGKNFIVDRTVKGKVTIISPTRITEEDAYRVFESVLEVHGFTTVPSGSVIKIILKEEIDQHRILYLQTFMVEGLALVLEERMSLEVRKEEVFQLKTL